MLKDEAKATFEKIVSMAKTMRTSQNELAQVFFFCGDFGVTMMPASPDLTKDQTVYIVKQMAASMGARYVIFVTEAWQVITKPGEEMLDVAVSERPDRKEIAMVSIDGPDLNITARMDVLPDGSLGEPEYNYEVFSGRFSDLSGGQNVN